MTVKSLWAALLPVVLGAFPLPSAAQTAKHPKEAPADFAGPLLQVASSIQEGYVSEVSTGDLIGWAVRGLYGRLDEDAHADVEDRLGRVDGMREEELRALLRRVRRDVGQSRDVSDDRCLDLALEEMTRHLDDQTRIIYRPDRGCMLPEYASVGVGLRLRSDPSTGLPQVLTPLRGGPAHQAGIQAGDVISRLTFPEKADGHSRGGSRVIPAEGLSLTEFMHYLEGRAGTHVGLTVRRPGKAKPLEYGLIRAPVPEETVLGYRRRSDGRWDYWIDTDRKLAYIRLTGFKQTTPDDLERVLNDLRRVGLKGLVLDLRFSPGGYLDAGCRLASLFIGDGPITSIHSRRGIYRKKRDEQGSRFLGFPLACLVNAQTAGMSEVVAACLQDHRRAVIMGERSKGDAAVPNLLRVNDHMELHLTSAIFCRPNGKKLHRMYLRGPDADQWGVIPEREYTQPLSARQRQELAEHLERQTFILPPGRSGKDDGSVFDDRPLEMAISYLHSHGAKP